MLLRPTRFAHVKAPAPGRQSPPKPDLAECLIAATVEAADPWRALAQLRRQMSQAGGKRLAFTRASVS
jgi:hypothetical protein